MKAGELTHLIVIQIKSIFQDNELNATEIWNDWCTVWAQSMPKTGREYYKLATVNTEITEAFKIRYIAGITAHQRIKFRKLYLEIIDVINVDEKNVEIIITCKAVV